MSIVHTRSSFLVCNPRPCSFRGFIKNVKMSGSEKIPIEFFLWAFSQISFFVLGDPKRHRKKSVGRFLGWRRFSLNSVKWPYLCPQTIHTLDFWYSKRYWQYLLLDQKSSAWVVCRRRYGHFTEFTENWRPPFFPISVPRKLPRL